MEKSTLLTAEQIQILFDFTTKKYVKYFDVQYELVDHLASGIEEQMSANPDTGFDTALEIEYGKFPVTGFYHFVEQKEKALLKYWKRNIWSVIRSYFRLPQLLLTLTLFFGLYFFYSNFKIEITLSIGYIITFTSMLYYIVKSYRNKSKYLFVQKFYAVLNAVPSLAMAFFYIVPQYGSYLKLSEQVVAIWYAASVSFMLIFLIGAFSGQFQKLLEEEIQSKYAHLKILD